MNREVEKQIIPVVTENDNPVAIVFFNKNRDRIIYMLKKASEDDIINLISKSNKLKKDE